jgi:hypothetical protein
VFENVLENPDLFCQAEDEGKPKTIMYKLYEKLQIDTGNNPEFFIQFRDMNPRLLLISRF